jgi:hypothetical protein
MLKYRLSIALIAITSFFALTGFGPTTDAATSDATPNTCDSQKVNYHLNRTDALLQKGYSKKRWEDETPLKDSEKQAIKSHKFCLTQKSDRKEVSEQREKYKERFEAYRLQRTILPFKGPDGNWYAIPYQVVWCETKVTNAVPHGYYALVDWRNPTWNATQYGPNASAATFIEQSIVAHAMYVRLGLSPWKASQSCWG